MPEIRCEKGHVFFKSSSCRSCPECARLMKPESGFLALLSAPARRAFEARNVSSVEQLSRFSETEILSWHGVGKSTIPKLREALREKNLDFLPINSSSPEGENPK